MTPILKANGLYNSHTPVRPWLWETILRSKNVPICLSCQKTVGITRKIKLTADFPCDTVYLWGTVRFVSNMNLRLYHTIHIQTSNVARGIFNSMCSVDFCSKNMALFAVLVNIYESDTNRFLTSKFASSVICSENVKQLLNGTFCGNQFVSMITTTHPFNGMLSGTARVSEYHWRHTMIICDFLLDKVYSTLMLLVGWQEGYPACSKLSGGVLAWVTGMRSRFAYDPAYAIATHCLLFQ